MPSSVEGVSLKLVSFIEVRLYAAEDGYAKASWDTTMIPFFIVDYYLV